MTRQKGFTLIELLVVLAILGVLVGVGIPNVTRFISAGDLQAANLEANTVRSALGLYVVDNAKIPDNIEDVYEYIDGEVQGEYEWSADTLDLVGVGGWPGLTWDRDIGRWVK